MIAVFRWCAILALLVQVGCGSSTPPRIFVLGAPQSPVPSVSSEVNRSVLELSPVSVPDYLNTTDILLRNGQNELRASLTGRWGERLAVGITDALRSALAKRMPGISVVLAAPAAQSARRLLVDVDAFDVMPDGQCVLTAHWTIQGDDRRTLQASERATIVTLAPRSSGDLADAAVVAAMTDAIDQLSARIAGSLPRVR
jgi:uncharacterized protein